MKTETAEPTTVGEMLLEEFLNPLNMSSQELAYLIGVTHNRMFSILYHRQRITKNVGKLLAEAFLTDDSFWNNLQKKNMIYG
ncbi:HigA family addiction module antitoxin [Cronobacter sakazakii]